MDFEIKAVQRNLRHDIQFPLKETADFTDFVFGLQWNLQTTMDDLRKIQLDLGECAKLQDIGGIMDRNDALEAWIVRMDGDAQLRVVAGQTNKRQRLPACQRNLLVFVRPIKAWMADKGEERSQTVEILFIKAFFILVGQQPQVMDDGNDMNVLAGEMRRPFVVLVLDVKQQLVQIDGVALCPLACFGKLLFNRS